VRFRAVNLDAVDTYVQHLVEFGAKNVFGEFAASLAHLSSIFSFLKAGLPDFPLAQKFFSC